MNILVYLGNACQFQCDYCRLQKMHLDPTPIDFSFIENYLNEVYSVENPLGITTRESNEFRFAGGEPFLYTEIMSKTIDLAKQLISERGYAKPKFSLETNGYNTNTDEVKEFIRKYPEVLIGFSVDGNKECHDMHRLMNGKPTYDIVWQNFLTVDTANKGIRWTVNADTAHCYSEVIKQWLTMGYRFIALINENDSDFGTYGYKVYAEQLKDLVNWYAQQDYKWIINHYCVVQYGTYRPKFIEDIISKNTYNKHSVKLDCNGDIIYDVDRVDTKDFELDDRCFGCPIGNVCYSKTKIYGSFRKDWCNIHALRHIEKVFFHNMYLYAQSQLNMIPNTALNLLTPKKWVVELLGNDVYKLITDITTKVGGSVIDLDTYSYTREQIDEIKSLMQEN